jgi:hypothetical protein
MENKVERIQWEALKLIKELIELDPSLYNKTLEEVIEKLSVCKDETRRNKND